MPRPGTPSIDKIAGAESALNMWCPLVGVTTAPIDIVINNISSVGATRVLSTFGVKDWNRGHHPVGAKGVLDSRNYKRRRRPRYILYQIIGGKGALHALNHRCPRYIGSYRFTLATFPPQSRHVYILLFMNRYGRPHRMTVLVNERYSVFDVTYIARVLFVTSCFPVACRRQK